jgi:site-specific recombinase XerD
MTALREKMIFEMELHRLSPSTQYSYAHAVEGLARFYGRAPDKLTPDQIRTYIHYVQQRRKLAYETVNIIVCALLFFYVRTLGWDGFELRMPPRKHARSLPEVLSVQEVGRLLAAARNLKHRALLMTTYAAGLRVSETVHLKSTHIHTDRMQIRVVQGKGRKDRYSILSSRLLEELRTYWRAFRPPCWLFPGSDPKKPMSRESAGLIYKGAKKRAGIQRGRGIHTLRHCFATHLLEAGVDPRTIQVLMGHSSISTTMRYLRVARPDMSQEGSPFDLLQFSQGDPISPE